MQDNKIGYPSLEKLNSPFHNAPLKLKQFLKEMNTNQTKTSSLPHQFQSKDSAPVICTKRILNGQKYIFCETCSINSEVNDMVYCIDCFVADKHPDHKYQEKVSNTNYGSCDCGRKLRLNAESFCDAHFESKKSQAVEVENQQDNEFTEYFRSVFQIYFYLLQERQNVEYFEKTILQTLNDLCSKSRSYTKMTGQILDNFVEVEGQKITFLEALVRNSTNFEPLLYILLSDPKFNLKFALFFVELQEKGIINMFPFSRLKEQFLDSYETLIELSKKGIFFQDKIENYSRLSEQSEGLQLLLNFYKKMSQKLQPKQYLILLTKNYQTKSQTSSIASTKLKNFFLSESILTIAHRMQNPKPEEQQYSKIFIFVCRLILNYCDDKLQNLDSFWNIVGEIGLKESDVEIFLEKTLAVDKCWKNFSEANRTPILVSLILCNKHSKKAQLIDEAWKKIIFEEDYLENLPNIFNFISLLANSCKQFPVLAVSQQEYGKSEIELKQQIFKCYLYEVQEVNKELLWNQYNSGWLNFSSAGSIVKAMCDYSDGTNTFKYKSSEEPHENFLVKIPEKPSRNWQNYRKLKISYDQKVTIKSPLMIRLFTLLFHEDSFFNTFTQMWRANLEKVEIDASEMEKWKSKGVGETYILLFLIIQKLCCGNQSQCIKDEIEKLRTYPDERFKFEIFGDRENILKLISCAESDPVQEEVQDQVQESETEILKSRAQLKKQQLNEKYKKKRNVTLERFASKQSETVREEEDELEECLFCHEKEKKNKEMVYLAYLSKNSSISQVLHGNEVKTKTNIDCCFHTIHTNCFIQTKKQNNMEFKCPLCGNKTNCFLPVNIVKASQKAWNMCWNIINALLVTQFKIFDADCLFSLMFDYIVESKGFGEIIVSDQPEANIKRKNRFDQYVLRALEHFMENAEAKQKAKFKLYFTSLDQQIDTCTKKGLKQFQHLILKLCWSRVVEGVAVVDERLLVDLSQMMNAKQFGVLKSVVEDLTQEEVEVSVPEDNHEEVCFGINLFTPEKSIAALLKLRDSKRCGSCESANIQTQCLICKLYFCQACEDDGFHSESHFKNVIRMHFDDGRMEIEKNSSRSEYFDIYFNDFMIPYREGRNKNSNCQYWIDNSKVSTVFKKFLNIRQ